MIQTSPNSIRSFLVWVWGAVLIVGSALYWAISTGAIPYSGSWLPVIAGASAVVGLPFLVRYTVKREWWSLITSWIFMALGGIIAVLYLFPQNPQLVVAAALTGIAIPLGGAYFVDRRRWWFIVPAYLLLTAAALVILTALSAPLEALAGAVVVATALAFWGTVLLYPQARWAMIPAIILTVAALIVLVFFVILEPGTSAYFIVLNGTLAAAMFATCFMVRRLDWALWIGVGFTAAAVVSYWYPNPANWALIALALGGYILYRQTRASRPVSAIPASSTSAVPATRPPAQTSTPTPTSTAVPQITPASSTAAIVPPAQPTPEPPPPAVKGPPPGVEFIPLDPLKGRKKDNP